MPYKAFVKDNALLLIGNFLIYIQGIFSMPLIIKTVGASTYGGYVLLISIISLVYTISSLGVGFNYKRYFPSTQTSDGKKKLFYEQFYFHILSILILSFCFLIFSSTLKNIFFKNEINFSSWLVIIYLICYVLHSQGADYLRYAGRMDLFNYSTVGVYYLGISFAFIFYALFRKLSVNALLICQIISFVVIVAPIYSKLLFELGWHAPALHPKELVKDSKLGSPVIFAVLVDFILNSSSRYVIAYYTSLREVGYYSPASSLGILPLFFAKVSGVVLLPLLPKLLDNHDDHKAEVMMEYTIKGFLIIAIPFIVGCGILGGQVLSLFANEEVAQHAHGALVIISVGAVFWGLSSILSNILFIKLRTSVLFKTNLYAAIINLSLTTALLYQFRTILIAAVTMVIGYLVMFVYVQREVSKCWRLHFAWDFILKICFSSLIMAAFVFCAIQVLPMRPYGLLISIVVGIAGYLIGLLLSRAFSSKEWTFFRSCLTRHGS